MWLCKKYPHPSLRHGWRTTLFDVAAVVVSPRNSAGLQRLQLCAARRTPCQSGPEGDGVESKEAELRRRHSGIHNTTNWQHFLGRSSRSSVLYLCKEDIFENLSWVSVTGIARHYEYQNFERPVSPNKIVEINVILFFICTIVLYFSWQGLQVIKKPEWILSLREFPIRSEVHGVNMLKLNYDGLFGPL